MRQQMKRIAFGALGGAIATLAGMAIKRFRNKNDETGRPEEEPTRPSNRSRPAMKPYPPQLDHSFHGRPGAAFAHARPPLRAGAYYHRGNR
jgi:hypothetical protein